jgi:hypothetical protein
VEINKIAQALLARQNSGYSFVLDAKTREALGSDGLSEALSRRWVESSFEGDCLMVTQRATLLEEIKDEAEKPDAAKSNEGANGSIPAPAAACQVCGGWTSHGGMSQHAASREPVQGRCGCDCDEFKHALGQRRESLAAVCESAIGRRTFNFLEDAVKSKVGDAVAVVVDGKVYPAVVQSVKPDGKAVLSFGEKKPSVVKPEYDAAEYSSEVKPLGREDSKPAAPAPVTTAGPAAPGLSGNK